MTESDRELIRQFVASFELLDTLEMSAREVTEDVRSGDLMPLLLPSPHPGGWHEWRPVSADLSRNALQSLYQRVSGPLPPLYESLILSYLWAEVDLGRLRLLANLPPDLHGLTAEITKDTVIFDSLERAGVVQFGKGPDMDYDPICFDLRTRGADGDCRIVKFDHEEIFGGRRLVEVEELAPSVRRLMELVVEDARQKGSRIEP